MAGWAEGGDGGGDAPLPGPPPLFAGEGRVRAFFCLVPPESSSPVYGGGGARSATEGARTGRSPQAPSDCLAAATSPMIGGGAGGCRRVPSPRRVQPHVDIRGSWRARQLILPRLRGRWRAKRDGGGPYRPFATGPLRLPCGSHLPHEWGRCRQGGGARRTAHPAAGNRNRTISPPRSSLSSSATVPS